MKKTKIVCSIGPASSDKEVFRKLAHAGMNVARNAAANFLGLEKENKIIITGGLPLTGEGRITNFLKIEEIK